MPRRFPQWLIVAVAFAIPVGFALYANHAWEDYYITLRSSRNLVEGRGLVYNAGDHLHTFTSPLGVLVPALCTWLAGPDREQVALWIFRIFNAGMLAAAAALLWRRCQVLGLGWLGRLVLFGLLLADPKLMDFATNGQETAMLVFFVVLLWSELEAPDGPRAGPLAAAFGGLMWTRPDAFVLAGAIVLPHLLLRARGDGSRSIAWASLVRGGLLGGLVYVPWFAWAWWYYGSPVPHTIIAKAADMASPDLMSLVLLPLTLLGGDSHLDGIFLPSYWQLGGWPAGMVNGGHALAVLAAFTWFFPRVSFAGRRASLALFLGAIYLCAIHVYPWYLPAWTTLACLALAFAADCAWSRTATTSPRWFRPALVAACAVALAGQVALLGCVAWQARVQQRVIEEGGRRAIGEWLRVNATPGDTVFLEPLGYIGYFSRLKTYDFPGLSSREVVTTIRQGARTYLDIIGRLKPDWVILRAAEIQQQHITESEMRAHYRAVKVVDRLPELQAIPFLPGRPWLEYDSRFVVFERLRGPEATP